MTCLILCLQMLALFVQLAAPTSPSCECPSCNQRNQVERCRCCVYRQLGKRSDQLLRKWNDQIGKRFDEHFIADYPHVDDHPETIGPDSSPPILSLLNDDDVATKLTDYLNANHDLKPTHNFALSGKPWLGLEWANLDNDLERPLKLNYVIQLSRNMNDNSS